MLPTRTSAIILGGALTAIGAAPARAQDQPADLYRDTVTVGAGVAALPVYEGSNDYRITPVPAAIGAIKGYGFVLAGNQLSVDLIKDRPGPVWDFQAGPIAQLNFNHGASGSIDDLRVRALGKRATAVELGGYVGIGKTGVLTSPYDKLSVTLGYRHDVSGVHDSGIWNPSITYFAPLSRKAAIGLFASADIVERGYAQTYYSVSAAQSVASGLPIYTAGAGLKNWTLGAIGSYSLTGDLLHGVKIVAGGTYGRMDGDIARSPLVAIAGSRDQWLGTIGLAYTF
ncbi:MipA/OmpV family protein [Sphingomonas albertensis]|uniref:MipA/OmpV family protein n=1 Tax=Sphingomonas albertensis TaxID=2762591 RepID=A0ABR7AI90_9SPHN|nr:MipA/OmpV family protein [Sphingomonas albertensis]MBC3940168.1 MipA/OmpV family protein [Sphingomonas albertensis]